MESVFKLLSPCTPHTIEIMRIQTPFKFSKFAYFGLDTKARTGDELIAVGLGKLYAGVYPTSTGYDLSVGILNQNGAL